MTRIYHITHVDNLTAIVAAGCLWCDNQRPARAPGAVSIAHQHIKDRRAARAVPIDPGGTLADYVPFYFAPRSPMLFAIHRNKVDGYNGGQRPILHLVSTVKTVDDLGLPFVFSDGHAEILFSEFSSDPADLERLIDAEVMQSNYWNDTMEFPDRKRRRQAEFLVQRRFPWSAVRKIGVHDDQVRRQVEVILRTTEHKPEVAVEAGWYY